MTSPETRLLARFTSGTSVADIPGFALEAAQRSFIDAVAVMLAASGLGEGCEACADVARVSGTGPCVVIGHDFRSSAAMAAFANGAMAHAMDFEDTHDHAIAHPHAAAVPAALAMADMLGDVRGDDLLAAISLAGDLVCRIAASFTVNPDNFGWHTTPWLGVFGAATAAGRLLRLDAGQMLDAWSLAMSQMGSFGELKNAPASHVRAIRDGFAAQAGVLGAMLASRGVRGYDDPLQGGAGFLAGVARNQYEPRSLTDGLGERFMGSEVSFKPWPSCRGTHAYIDASLRLASRIKFEAGDVTRIDVVINEKNRMLCEPRSLKVRPDNAINAKFSIPFTTAAALVRRDVNIETFSPDILKDERILALAEKVHHHVDPDIPLRDVTRGSVTLHIGAASETEQIVHALGHPLCPMTPESLERKFNDCVQHAKAPPSAAARQDLWKALSEIRACADVRSATRLLLGGT